MNQNQNCFLNGSIVPNTEAKISIFDIGLTRGLGVYEALPAFNGKLFRFNDHWNRLLNSAHFLNINIPITEEKAEKVVKELLEKNGQTTKRVNVKFILTGGVATGSLDYNFETPTICIFTEDWTPLSKEMYENGSKLVTYTYVRDLPEIKTVNYSTAVNLQNWRKEESAVEVLFVKDGEVSECSTSNIFIIKNGILITPSENALKGITRKVVLELAEEMNIKSEERPVLESELQNADEVFITSSFKDIVPVTKIDDFKIDNGEVGSITKDLMTRFDKLVEN